jgi:hypothetical protein
LDIRVEEFIYRSSMPWITPSAWCQSQTNSSELLPIVA